MRISEIDSGFLPTSNIPVFNNPHHECDIDGYKIMSSIWNGYYVLGILDTSNIPYSYMIIEPESNGTCKLREIFTDPQYRNKNLAAILLLSIRKLNVKLLLSHNEIVSNSARQLILKMVKNNRLNAKLNNCTLLDYNSLSAIFNIIGKTDDSIIIESQQFLDWECRYRKDEVLAERWRIRDSTTELYD